MNYKNIMDKLDVKMEAMVKSIGDKSPHVAKEDKYDDMIIEWWTSGFWPGMLWIMHDVTKKDIYKKAAAPWTVKMAEILKKYHPEVHHDVGFQFLPTAVIDYKITGDEEAKNIAYAAATFLAGRFNPVGFIRSWNGMGNQGYSIIDSTMNISLLFWAAEELKDDRFFNIATMHASTIEKHFVRPDGTVNHIVVFDPKTGAVVEAKGGQGYGPESQWSRGQAWAIYGLANCYKYTKDEKYLNAAMRVANSFIAALPEDYVAYWDLRLPSVEGEPRDTSAAACAASGLIEIAKHLPKEKGRVYGEKAEKILESLTDNYSKIDDLSHEAILISATGHKPANSNVNVSIIYGDYFYLEAIAKLNGWNNNIF